MEFQSVYDIAPTAAFIHSRNFTKVILQFPPELFKDAPKVPKAIRKELRRLRDSSEPDTTKQNGDRNDVELIVAADTTIGNCCVGEDTATRLGADCVVHYGHACLSPTSVLPAFFVFGKAAISISECVRHIADCAAATDKPILVLYGLDYAYAMQNVRQTLMKASIRNEPGRASEFVFADVMCSVMEPPKGGENSNSQSDGSDTVTITKYSIGGLIWNLPDRRKMEDYLLIWIGSENSAFSNVVLTYNGCEIVRYDAAENHMVTDFLQQRKILKRRYYLVEKAKDANIIGVLVRTLGISGYLNTIHQMNDLIAKAGKKSYPLVMDRPNPAGLANFPECDVIIYVSCAQTALLDSKEFLAPVITPFEAMLAFNRGSQWTGVYLTEFRNLINLSPGDMKERSGEARYSFLQGGYVEDVEHQDDVDEGVLTLSNTRAKALQSSDKHQSSRMKGVFKSGAEFLSTRSYQGLELHNDVSSPDLYVIGRTGKASGYADEKSWERS